MIMDERKIIATLDVLIRMRKLLPNGAPNLDNKDVAMEWAKILCDIPPDVLTKVAKDAIFTYDFFPSIAKLREAAKDFGHKPDTSTTYTLLEGEVQTPLKKKPPEMGYLERWQTLYTDTEWKTCCYLQIALPEPQCHEKQYTVDAVADHIAKITKAGFRVVNVQYNSGKETTENGRQEPNVKHSALLQVIKPGVTKYEADY